MDINNLNFVDKAEEVFTGIKRHEEITTSKIRNILSTASVIYDKAKRKKGKLTAEEQASVQILRMNLIYDSGRDRNVKNFVNRANLLKYLKQIGDSRENLLIFCRYLESLVAFHKFEGGK